MRTYAVLSSLTNAITAAIIGTLIYRKSRGSPLHITYVFACASVVLWGLGYFFWQLSIHAEQALLYCRLLMVGAIFIPIFFFHHILILLDQKKPTLLKICYLSGFAFLIADFTPWFVAGVRSKRVFPFWPVAGPFFAPFLASFVAIAFYKLWLIYKALVGSSGNRRSQLFYVFFGTCIAYAGGVTNFALWYDVPIYPIGNLAVSVYLGITSYAILRHRLLDINVIVRKTLIYSVVMGVLTAIYLVIVAIFAKVFEGLTGYQTVFSSTVAALLITSCFQPLRKKVQTLIDGKFFRLYVDREEKLYELSREVITHTTPEAMAGALMHVIDGALHPKAGALFLRSPDGNGFTKVSAAGSAALPERMPEDNELARYFRDHSQPFVQDLSADLGQSRSTRLQEKREEAA